MTFSLLSTAQSCILLLLLQYSHTIHAFPSMLVESKGGCMIDLLDPEEIVMNSPIVPYSSSTRPDLYVGVIKDDDDSFTKGPIPLEADKKYKVTLVNPGEALPDVQYAIEVNEGAHIVGGGCEGKRRSHGRLSDLRGHDLVFDSLEKEIRVVAGWAGGHEAVQLTDALVFVPAKKKDDTQTIKEKAVDETNPIKDTPKKEEEEEVIGVQVVEKHQPHDVNTQKMQAADVVEGKKSFTQNAAEGAHKDALEAELQVLKEEVQDIGKNHADIEDKMHVTMTKHENKPNEAKTQSDGDVKLQETIQRFKQKYQEKHGDKKQDTAHEETKADDRVKRKERVKRNAQEEASHQDTIKRFKDAFRQKHVIPDVKKVLNNGEEETSGQVYKRMHDAMFAKSDVARRRPPQGFFERIQSSYARQNEDSGPIDMRSYMYGVMFFIIANLCIVQLCLWIGKRDKGRRLE